MSKWLSIVQEKKVIESNSYALALNVLEVKDQRLDKI
jgi:hypothetical protein